VLLEVVHQLIGLLDAIRLAAVEAMVHRAAVLVAEALQQVLVQAVKAEAMAVLAEDLLVILLVLMVAAVVVRQAI
jgi:hypothetical protein